MYKNEIAREIRDWVRIAFKPANTMHQNLHENNATGEDVEDVLGEAEKLVNTIKKTLEK